jgi:hypothetical protein
LGAGPAAEMGMPLNSSMMTKKPNSP